MTCPSAAEVDGDSPPGGTSWAAMIAVVLSFASGATDAFAFLRLGGIFTANMTGNLVLSGLTARPGYVTTLAGATVAIVAFAASVFIALKVMPVTHGTPQRPRLIIALSGAVSAQAVVLAIWIGTRQHPNYFIDLVLVALSSVAMGMQTGLARRIETRSGVTTTFVTGTLTALMASFADHIRGERLVRLGVVFALVAGALSGSLLLTYVPPWGAALPLVPSVAGLVVLVIAPTSLARRSPHKSNAAS